MGLLDKLIKPKEEVKTTTTAKPKTTTISKAKTASQTKTSAVKAKPVIKAKVDQAKRAELQKADVLKKQKEAIAKKTNQDIINAAYKVAEELKLKGGPWPLLRAAGWGNLTDKRGDLYKGPAIDEIKELTAEQKAALKKVLDL